MSTVLDLAIAISVADFATSSVNRIIGQFRLLQGASQETLRQMDRFRNIAFGGAVLTGAGVLGFKAVSNAIQASAEEAMKFEDVMNNVKITGFGKDLIDTNKAKETKKTIDELTTGFEKLGIATKFSDKSVAEAAHGMLSGGMEKEFLLGSKDKKGRYNYSGLSATMFAAQLGNIDPHESGDFIAKMKSAYNMNADKTLEAVNFFTKTAAASTLNMKELIPGMLTAGGAGGSMGLSAQDTALLVAATATYTKDGASAGTYTKDFIDRLVPKSKKQKETMEQLGWLKKNGQSIFFNDDGKIKDADYITKVLQESAKNHKSDEFKAMMHKVFLAQGERTAIALAAPSNIYGSIKGNIGNQLDMYQQIKIQMSGTLNTLETMKETWNITKRVFGEPFLDPLKNAFKGFNTFLGDHIIQWGKAHPTIIRAVGAFGLISTSLMTVAGIGMVLYGAFGALNLAMAAAGITLGGIAAACAPVALAIGAVAVLGYGISELWKKNEAFRNNMSAIWEDIKSAVVRATTPIRLLWSAFGDEIKTMAGGAWNEVKLTIKFALEVVGNTVAAALNFITFNWSGAWDNLKNIVKAGATFIKDVFSEKFRVLDDITNGTLTRVVNAFKNLPSTIGNFANDMGSKMGSWFKNMPSIKEWAEKQHKENIRQFGEWGSNISDWFSNTKDKISESLNNWGKSISAWFQKMPGNITKFFKNWTTNVVAFFNDIPNKIGSAVSGIGKAFSNIFKGSEKIGSDLVKKITSGAKKEKRSFMDNLGKTIVDGIVFTGQLAGIVFLATGRELIKRTIFGVVSMKGAFSKSFETMISSAKGIFDNAITSARKWGSNLIDSFVNGIKSKLSAIPEALKKAASTIKDWLGVASPTKEGPLSTNHLWGGNLMKSIANGMINNAHLVKQASTIAANAMDVHGSYSLDGPKSNIKVKHPSESGNFVVQGPLVHIEKIEQQPGEDANKLAERVAQMVEKKLQAIQKRNSLTRSNAILAR